MRAHEAVHGKRVSARSCLIWQVGSVRKVFRTMDVNHKGHIDKLELRHALRMLCVEATDEQAAAAPASDLPRAMLSSHDPL